MYAHYPLPFRRERLSSMRPGSLTVLTADLIADLPRAFRPCGVPYRQAADEPGDHQGLQRVGLAHRTR
jgi:hypothetical protein